MNGFWPQGYWPDEFWPDGFWPTGDGSTSAFPTTGVLDAFNRADSTTTIGGNWSIFGRSGTYDMGISSNQAYNPDAQWNRLYYNAAQYGPDCEAYLTLATLHPQNATFSLFIRLKDATPDTATFDGYRLMVYRYDNAGTDTMQFRLARIDNSAVTQISSPFGLTNPAAGLKVGMSAVGTTIKAYYDSGSGWTEVLSATDATYGAAGYLGFYWDSESTSRMDDFGGGTFVPAAIAVTLDLLTAAGAARSLAVVPGAAALPLNLLSLGGSALDLAVAPGAVSQTLDLLAVAGAAPDLTVVPGTATILLDLLTGLPAALNMIVSVEGVDVAVMLALVSHELATLPPSVVPGAIGVDLALLPGALSALLTQIQLGEFAQLVMLSSLGLSAGVNALAVVPGAVGIPLSLLDGALTLNDLLVFLMLGCALAADRERYGATVADAMRYDAAVGDRTGCK